MSFDLVWIELEGAVVVKPSLHYFKTGAAVLNFGMLCEPKYHLADKGGKDTRMYFTVTTIGSIAETCYKVLKLGMPVRVEGEYKDSVYLDKKTDEKKVGRLVYAKRIKALVFWKYRTPAERKKQELDQIKKLISPDVDTLPY